MDCLGGHGWPPMSECIKICRLFILTWKDDHFTMMNEYLKDPERAQAASFLTCALWLPSYQKTCLTGGDNNNPVHSQLFD